MWDRLVRAASGACRGLVRGVSRFSRAISRHERLVIALALAAVGLVLAAFLAIHVVLSGDHLRRWVNGDPESLFLDYESASSLIPGIVQVRGLTIRGSDPNVLWSFRMERATISVSLVELFRKRFHATRVRASGLVFRLRERAQRDPDPAHQARLPSIPGFHDSLASESARSKPGTGPAPAKPQKGFWTVFVEDLVADPTPEIWIDLYRFRGHARVTGSFSIHPDQQDWVGPAAVRFLSGDLTLGPEQPLMTGVSGETTCTIRPFDPDRVRGSHVWALISGNFRMQGRLTDLGFVNHFLRHSKEPRLSGGVGAARLNVTFDHGIGRGDAPFEAREVSARYGKGTLSGRAAGKLAITRWEMEKDVMDLSGSRIDLAEIRTSATAHDARDWWGHFQIPSGRLQDGLHARAEIDARDARPLYTLFRANLPGWAQGILRLDGIHATARVHLGSDVVEVRELEARGGQFHIAGEYEERKSSERGAFLVESGLLALGLEIDPAASHLHLLGARKWFEQERTRWQRLAEASSP
jgi:hypothetical protein